MRALVAALTATVLGGCFPVASTYLRIEAPEARYIGNGCWGSAGAPSVAYFRFHGAFISLNIDHQVRLGLHLPSGTTGQLNGDAIKIEGESSNGPITALLRIKPMGRGSVGTINPREFLQLPDPCSSNGSFGPFVGETKNGGHLWCMFLATSESDPHRIAHLPPGLVSGVVEIPSVTVNGIRYDPARLPFRREPYREMAPINC
jgi:hypothetical protein